MAKHRHKRRTHVTHDPTEGVPKSMVLKMGDAKRKPTKALGQLVRDFRNVMQPHTAAKLQERRSNRLKDYVVMAGPLGVTHLFVFSQSANGHTTLRIAKTPRGPTLYFRVDEYVLCRDIQRSQARPHALSAREMQQPPVLVMNNFTAAATSDKDALLTSMFHNMLPSIQVDSATQLSSITRCLLIDRIPGTQDQLELRHYAVVTRPVGSSRAVKKLAAARRGQRAIPNLGELRDVSEYVADPGLSESEGEDEVLADAARNDVTPEGPRVRTAVKLVEVGPRLRLTLTKIEDGVCQGRTLFHALEKRTEKEARALDSKHHQRDAERLRRRKEQEANVLRKREAAAARTTRSQRGKARAAAAQEADGASSNRGEDENSDSDGPRDVEDMSDDELAAELAANESDGDSDI